jgi:hypothetical protein
VYDAGSFFVSHRDTEKAPGMFATLVIVLPSLYTGGELLVRHRGQEARLELNITEPSEVAFAAFYADCLHEVLPINSGCRLTLIYNLLRTDKTPVSEPPEYGEEQDELADCLLAWAEDPLAADGPVKLIYPLEHAYTQAELSFAALKGTDANRAAIAVAAAEQAECDVYLALVSIHESGYAEYDHYRSRRRGRHYYEDDEDNDGFEIGEVTERDLFLSDWRKPDDSEPPLDSFPFTEAELCPPDAFEGLEPNELDFQEATGNAGASFDRTYQRAALVFWPSARRLAVLNQAGLHITLPYLNDLAERWAQSGGDFSSALWQEAHELAGHMLRTWPLRIDYYPRNSNNSSGQTAHMLGALWRLQDAEHIEAFLATVSAAGHYAMGDNDNLLRAIGLLPPPRAAGLIGQIIAKSVVFNPGACADLLARCAHEAWAGEPPTALIPAARALTEDLPGDPKTLPPDEPWRRYVKADARLVVDLLTALERISAELAGQSVDCMLARSAAYDLDAILIPALLNLGGQSGAATGRLREAGLAHLARRIAEPLAPPSDWTRTSAIACRCKHCAELSRFLADPGLKEWSLKAAQQDRSHVESSIRAAVSDLDLKTDTRGRPYTLVCVKNQASYQRRVRQREQDLAQQAALRQAAGTAPSA